MVLCFSYIRDLVFPGLYTMRRPSQEERATGAPAEMQTSAETAVEAPAEEPSVWTKHQDEDSGAYYW